MPGILPWLLANIEIISKLLTTATIVFGAGFAAYRYLVTAPLVPRLELKLSGKVIGAPQNPLLLVSSEVKNVGLATAIFKANGKFLTLQFARPISDSGSIEQVQWTPADDSVHEAFPEETWLEAGETIRTEQLFALPKNRSAACRVELSLQANKFFRNLPDIWAVAVIVDLTRSEEEAYA